MPGAALVGLGRHDPDVLRKLIGDLDQRLEAGRMNAVVVGDEDAGAGEFVRSHFLGAGIVSSPPM